MIDTSYVPGFTWTRQPQLRTAKDFDKKLWLALSIENPQTNYYAGANGALPSTSGTATTSSPGGNLFPSTVNFSDEAAPDIIGKVAYDMKLAHLEAYGLLRFPTDRITNHGLGDNHTEVAGGAGAAAIIHIIPKVLDIQGSGLIGKGIGRYGSAQLPDAVVDSDGHPRPLREFEALAGLIAHPTPIVDLYAYGGVESVDSHAYTSAGKGYGYGSTLYINTGCETELSTACVANTSRVEQATVGGYFKALHSKDYGSVQLGMQYPTPTAPSSARLDRRPSRTSARCSSKCATSRSPTTRRTRRPGCRRLHAGGAHHRRRGRLPQRDPRAARRRSTMSTQAGWSIAGVIASWLEPVACTPGLHSSPSPR